jgi:hypothetical protein
MRILTILLDYAPLLSAVNAAVGLARASTWLVDFFKKI